MWLYHCRQFWLHKVHLQVLKEIQSKLCSELPCLGQLHVSTVGTTNNFKISNVSAEFCALLCVECLIAGHHAWLICMDWERKPQELYPPELQWLVTSRGFFLYKSSQSDQTIYTTCNRHFCWRFPSKHRTNSPLRYKRRPTLAKPQHAFSPFFFTWVAILTTVSAALQVKRSGNSSGTNYKLDHTG
jgi:hypothetical protein